MDPEGLCIASGEPPIIRGMFLASVITLGAIGMTTGVSAEDLRFDDPDYGRFSKQTESSARPRMVGSATNRGTQAMM